MNRMEIMCKRAVGTVGTVGTVSTIGTVGMCMHMNTI